ncbi:flagellar filament capping protein FliD [Persephonella sp.]
MAGEFSITNVTGQGFDYQSYLEKYKELKLIPVNLMNQQIEDIKKKKEALNAIYDKLSALMSPSLDLTLETTYETKKASFSNPDVASATVSDDAVDGTYSITVNALATANKWKVGTVAPVTDIDQKFTQSGSLTINYLKDGSATSLVIDYNNKSLRQIMEEINQSEDLEATIINLGSSSSPDYQLIIKSKNTGTDNAITGIDDSLNPGDDTAGIFSEDSTKTYETVAAQNAEVVIDGVTFSNSSNTLSGVINGVTLMLKDTGTTELTISDDYSGVKGKIEDILNGYNQLKTIIRLATGKGQPLQGEASLNSIATSIFGIISSYLGKYGLLDTEGDVETTKGLLKLKEDAFNDFIKRDDAKSVLQDLGRALENYLNAYSDSLYITDQKYSERISSIEERIQSMTESINREIENMRIRFARLNTYLAEMQSLQLRIENFAKGLSLQTNDQ